MKNITLLFFLVCAMLFAACCFEGHTTADGAALKQYIEPAKLKDLAEKPRADTWIVDVRPADAYREGHIPTAKSFPSGEIMYRLKEIPKTQNLILYCETGGRAQMVLKKLEAAGYTRMMNWGGGSRYFNSYGTEQGKEVKK